jgi:hypothetical protein
MSKEQGIEALSLLPNRLAVADFTPAEIEQVLGKDLQTQELAKANFNWLGAYLVEEAGLFEGEVSDWFKSNARGLAGKSPLDFWDAHDGFEAVFEYAKEYKGLVDEALADEPPKVETAIDRSFGIARSALSIIHKGFETAGVELKPDSSGYTTSRAITNPGKENAPFVRWKGNSQIEDYRVMLEEGSRRYTYYIVRNLMGGETDILQSGIVADFEGSRYLDGTSDSDIDGRAPSAGEVASFVIPLANEVKNRTLALHKANDHL